MLKYSAAPNSDFFEFDGSKITVKVEAGETAQIARRGQSAVLATGQPGKTLKVSGTVQAGDVFTVGEKSVSFYFVPQTSPLDSIKKFIREKKFIPQRGIFVKNEPGFEPDSKSKKMTLSVGIILLAVLGVSIGFGVMQKGKREKEEEKAKVVQEEIDKEASGLYSASPELFLDLTLLSAGFKGDTLSSSTEKLYVLDKNSKKIVSIEISSKKSEVVAGQGELSEVFDFASYEDRVFISDSEGIKEINDEAEKVVEKDWEGEILIQAFAGNLYVLDKNAGAIYRYSGGDSGFGSKQNWLAASTKPDFTDARSWTFDGAVYVLVGSKVLKFSQGSPQGFSLASEVLSVTSLYADEENQYLYVLDKENGKVFVLEKDGKFKAQYSSEEIKNAVNLIASEAEKKIILLTGEKLLSLEMRHL